MKRMAGVIIYILILLFGQVLLAIPSFADEACDPNQQSCADADSSQPEQESTPVAPSGGSSAGGSAGSAGGGFDAIYTGVDQRCWTKQDCDKTGFGKFIGPNDETKEACKMEKDGANNQIGFCLPTKQAQMGLNWGEAGGQKSTYTHIGEFIQWIYKYGIVVASILAVMMIIKAGFDWIMSGGNQEVISGAHKKIGNAMMGLFLAVMAYFVLNLINPYLVNLRLPNVWMINEAGLVPPYCDLAKDKKFYFAKYATDSKNANSYATAMQNGFKKYDEIKTECGREYYVEGSGGLTCSGTICDGNKSVCLKEKCLPGMLAGEINGTFGAVGVPAVDSGNNIKLLALCKSEGRIKEVADVDYMSNKNGDPFQIPQSSSIETICNGYGGTAGFYLGVQMNDETAFALGQDWLEGQPWTTGSDDWHAVGQTAPGSHDCSVNLSTAFQKKNYSTVDCGPGNIWCTCSYISYPTVAFTAANDPQFTQHLISIDELKKGYFCNIHINRNNFPAADNGFKWPTIAETAELTAAGGVSGAIAGTSVFPGLGTLVGTAVGAAAYPTAQVVINFWGLVDDPASCMDQN